MSAQPLVSRRIQAKNSQNSNSQLDNLYHAARKVGLSECSGQGVILESTDLSIPPISNLTGAVEKVLQNLYKLPEILESRFWDSVEKPARGIQWQLCQDFIQAEKPISGRVRVDSVITEYNDFNQLACAIEFEPHAGDDMLVHTLHEVYEQAGGKKNNYLDRLAAHYQLKSPNQSGKLRIVQWDQSERTDIDYSPMMEELLKEYRKRGLDGEQYLYNDAEADWQDALVYRIFEFSEAHKSLDQQKMIRDENAGHFIFANPAFVFGKLISLFATEYGPIFQERLGLTQEEMQAFPYTITAKSYIESPELQKSIDYRSLFLKGVLSEGSGGGNDVFPLKAFESQEKALDFIQKTINDAVGGWILQQEVPRQKFDLLQTCEYSGERFENKNAGILQRQIFIDGKLLAHYNLTSSRHAQASDKMHAEAGVAAFI